MFQRIGLFLLLFCYSPQYLHAQEWEFGAFTGASGYIGDLNTRNPFKFTDQANAFFLKYNYSSLSAYKFVITQAAIQANDANSSNSSQKQRNLNFNSAITELALLYEFNFFEFIPGQRKNNFTPYAFTGISYFTFNPQTSYNGNTYNLRDLGTEGQGTSLNPAKKYGTAAIAIPFGLGLKYSFKRNFIIGFELGYRNTLTDYLDDVSGKYVNKTALTSTNGTIAAALADRSADVNSGVYIGQADLQRGDQSRRDFYMFSGITISYAFLPIKCPPFSNK